MYAASLHDLVFWARYHIAEQMHARINTACLDQIQCTQHREDLERETGGRGGSTQAAIPATPVKSRAVQMLQDPVREWLSLDRRLPCIRLHAGCARGHRLEHMRSFQ